VPAEGRSAVLIGANASYTKNGPGSEIARAIGAGPKGSMTKGKGRIAESLKGLDTAVLIDEADYLSDGSLELVRRVINDKAQTGVVLAGLPRLKYKPGNLRAGRQQLTSRVGGGAAAGGQADDPPGRGENSERRLAGGFRRKRRTPSQRPPTGLRGRLRS
jgi:hypothetical protein